MMRRSSRFVRSASTRRSVRLGRTGFSLLEVVVALVILSIAMIGLGGMLTHAALTATQISARSARAALETQQLNRLAALPYDALDSQAGCVTTSTQPFPHTTCIALNTVGGGSGAKQVRLIIAPLAARIKADTSYLTRSKGTANPLAL
jgi:prepilin-type N-terminal cleavage/methylation domain-containing protein